MAMHQEEIVVEIDGHIERLIEEINSAPAAGQQSRFVDDFQEMLINQLIGPLGLTRAMFNDKDGGAITSLRNFEKGVVANEADEARYEGWVATNTTPIAESVSKLYEDALDQTHGDMASADGKYYDGYSGRELPVGPRTTARDHVIPKSAVERSSKGHLAQSPEERVATATQSENVVLTDFNSNSSKNDSDLMEWASKPSSKDPSKTNAEYYGKDKDKLRDAYERAKAAIDRVQNSAVLKKQAGELLVEGGIAAGKLALRQVLGMVIRDLVHGVVSDIRHLIRQGYQSIEELAALAKRRLQETWAGMRARWSEYLKEGAGAALSGFLGTLVTLLINALVTTVKNVVSMIREGVLAFVRAVRMIVSPPEGATAGDVARAVLQILSSAVAACVGLALEEAITKAMLAVPLLAPIATEVAPVIAGVLSGTLALATLLSFDALKSNLSYKNRQLADVHRGQTVNLLRIKQTVLLLEGARENLRSIGEALGEQFHETQDQVQRARGDSQRSLKDYRASVEGLDAAFEGL